MIHPLEYLATTTSRHGKAWDEYRCAVCCRHFTIAAGVSPPAIDDCTGELYRPEPVAMPAQPGPAMPSLWQQAKHLVRDGAEWLASGFPVASRIEQQRRLSVCRRNDCGKLVDGRCTECGCCVTLKAWTETGKCQLDKWQPHKDRWSDREIRAYMQRDPAEGREALPEITRRNLLFHVYPAKANDLWRWHVQRLSQGQAMDQFNGRRIVALALANDGSTESPEIVRAAFGRKRHSIEFIEVKNDARLREVKSFPRLLAEVASTHPYEATFYGHTKGNATADNPFGAELWTRTAYRVLLDDPARIGEVLRFWPAVGINVIRWPENAKPPYPTALSHGDWMFAGTFLWFRHDAVFSSDWNSVPDDRYGAEAWLSGVLPFGSGWSCYQAWPETLYPTPPPYDPWCYLDEVCG